MAENANTSLSNKELSDLRVNAESGDAKSQYQLAQTFFDGHGIERSLPDVVKWLTRAAAAGLPQAQLALCRLYGRPREGMQQNMSEAMRWGEMAAAQGDVNAQAEMGFLHLNDGEAHDEAK